MDGKEEKKKSLGREWRNRLTNVNILLHVGDACIPASRPNESRHSYGEQLATRERRRGRGGKKEEKEEEEEAPFSFESKQTVYLYYSNNYNLEVPTEREPFLPYIYIYTSSASLPRNCVISCRVYFTESNLSSL